MMETQTRFNVIGCKINKLIMKDALNKVIKRVANRKGGYVCFTNVHVSVMAREDRVIQEIINSSFMSLPDGKPLYWVAKLKGLKGIDQIPGPDFFPQLINLKTDIPLKHYFFGGQQSTLDELTNNIKSKYPDVEIVGTESPPFRELTTKEIETSLSRIKESCADIVWVGLGAPKQEKWMANNWQALKPAILFGVGAAFDFHAGNIQRAPQWVQAIGMEWLHRLLSEPSRLWKRYFYTNSMFLIYLIKDVIFLRK